MRGVARSLVAAALLALPNLAAACPACFDARSETRMAYIGTTAMLSLLPLSFIACVTLYVRARLRQRAAEPFVAVP